MTEAIAKLVAAVRKAFDENPNFVPTRGVFRGPPTADGRQCCGLGAAHLSAKDDPGRNESTIDWACDTFGLPYATVVRFTDGFDGIRLNFFVEDDPVQKEAYEAGLMIGKEYVDRMKS